MLNKRNNNCSILKKTNALILNATNDQHFYRIIPIPYTNSHDPLLLWNVELIRVYIDQRTTLKIVRTATVSVIDMISNVGGTLGLFCGVSILSLAELIYWAGKGFVRKRGGRFRNV